TTSTIIYPLSLHDDLPILVLSNGEFGERLHKISLVHNNQTHLIEVPWGEPFDLEKIAAYLERYQIDVIAMVHHETCSGMLNPLRSEEHTSELQSRENLVCR